MECSTIDSLCVNGGGKVLGKTELVQEACETVAALGDSFSPQLTSGIEPDIQNLTDYFGRPRLIYMGDLQNSIGRFMKQEMSPSAIFQKYGQAGLARLTGVYGVRYKLVFTLQVSSTPFHQGLLCLNWQYGPALQGVYERSSNSFTATNIPHVRMNLADTTMVHLEVPFLYFADFVKRDSDDVYGIVALNNLLPCPSIAGTSAPHVKLFLHLEDLELLGVEPMETREIVMQSRGIANKEAESDAYPFSSAGYALSRSVKFLGKGIPSLSSIAGVASWFLDAASGAARSFGFSKPTILDPPHKVVTVGGVLEHNVDMASNAVVVAPFSTNRTEIEPSLGGTEVDEMSFAYISSQWSQICVGNLSTAQDHGTTLYATGMGPSYFWARLILSGIPFNISKPVNAGGVASIIPSHLFFLASQFRYWRGSFKFRFTFAKTKLHGGRIMVMYIPNTLSANKAMLPGVTTTMTQPTGHSAIIDLRDSDTFEFDVPYTGLHPYADFSASVGTLSLTVLDPLLSSSVINNSVDFLVEVRATDFEVANLIGVTAVADPTGVIEMQSALIKPTYGDQASRFTVGEKFCSVKQLIMCPSQFSLRHKGFSYDFDFPPWFYHPIIPLGHGVLPPACRTLCGNWAQCYQFARGSTDLHVYQAQDTNHATDRKSVV